MRHARLAAAAFALLCLAAPSPALAEPEISAAEIFEIAQSGVGSPYVWGGGCWDPDDRSRLGADCSGYVAKCWQVPERSAVTACSHPYSTYNFYHERTYWDAVDRGAAEPADGFVRRDSDSGHIVLFASGDPWGNSEVYEARGTDYGIVHRTRTFDSSYQVRRRHSLIPDVPPHPNLTLSVTIDTIEEQGRDLCLLSGSEGLFDAYLGQPLTQRLNITNEGTAEAQELMVGVTVDGPYLEALRYDVLDNLPGRGCGDAFCPSDAADQPGNPPRDSPGASFVLALGALAPGETDQVVLTVAAAVPSLASGAHPEVRLWVRHVRDFYEKESYESTFNNVGGYQTFGGGDLRTRSAQDVLAPELCNALDDDCDGVADNGLDVGQPCAAGDGSCAAEGVIVCSPSGAAVCDASPSDPGDEECNGADDDCDGLVDEGCSGAEIEDPETPDQPDGPDEGLAGAAMAPLSGGCSCSASAGPGRRHVAPSALLLLAAFLIAPHRSRSV